MTDLNVGKFGKNGVDLSKFNGGLKKENLKTEEQKSIFDAIDADKNGVIDEKEMQDFKAKLDKSEDSHVSRREARKFLKENNLKDLSKNDVLKFLNEYAVNTENVKSAKVVEEGGKKTVHVEYEDGTSEVINPDRSSRISQTDQNGTTTTRFLDENKKLQKDTVSTQDGLTTETSYAEDGQTPTKQVISDNTKGSVSTVDYTEGKPSKKEVKQGATTSNYTFDEQGNEVLNSKVENQGIPAKEKRTDYTYNEDGTVSENIKENGKTTERLLKGDQIISEKINDNGKIYDRTYYEKGYEEKTTDDNGNPTVNVYSLDNKKLAQQKTINGQTVSVLYDGEGNTKTIVQNGESPSSIAKKFGCSVEDLVALNKDVLKGKKYFDVGAEIRVPGEIEADSKALKGRKSAAEAKAEYAKDEAIRAQKRAEAAAREAQYKAMGLINHKGQGKKITGTWRGGRKENFTIIGQAGNGRHLAKGKNGKLVTISHDGVVLDNQYVNNTNIYSKGQKIKAKLKVKSANGKFVPSTINVVEIKGANLPHGRKAVVDSKGKVYVMSHDGFLLDNNYVAKSNYADAIKGNKSTAQKATVDMLTNQLDSAQAAFDAQMKEDGWAADVADGISNIWGVFQEDGNQAWRVRKDLKAYRQNINELKAAAKRGDKQFQAKFKEVFGVNYNQAAIANYMMKPTDANYKKAFGTKNNIGQRVAKYNSSQQSGAAMVKGAASLAAGVLAGTVAGVLTGGVGLVALGATAALTSGASFAINASDRASSDVGLKDGELGQIAENAVWDGAAVLAGGVVGKVASTAIKGTKTAATVSRAAVSAAGDVAMGAAQEYAQTGEVTVEGTAYNAALGSVGMAAEAGAFKYAGKKLKNMFHKNPAAKNANIDVPNQSSTPVLDKASSQGNAHPADVKVGKHKSEQIKQEVNNVASNPKVKGDELAQVRNEVGAVSNREVRRGATRQIDEAAENLSAGEKAKFDAANRANSQANVDHIFDRHNALNDTDVRVMNDYIQKTGDVSVLRDLQKKLDIKEHTYGGVTANYKALRKSIEDRIAGLQPKTVLSNAQQRESVVSMLGEKAKTGKGLSPDEFNQVNDYISSIGDANQLKEIKGLLGGKKMTSAQKKQLKEVLENKTNELKMQGQPQVEPQGANDAAPVTEKYVDSHHIELDGTPKASTPEGATFEDFASVQRRLAKEKSAAVQSTPAAKPEAEVDPHHITVDGAPKASTPEGATFEDFASVQRRLAKEKSAAAQTTPAAKPKAEVSQNQVKVDETPNAPAPAGATFEDFASVQRKLAKEKPAAAQTTPAAKPEAEVDPHHITVDAAPKSSATDGATADFVKAQQQLKQRPHDDLVAMLEDKAKTGKGLNQDEFKQVNDYISTISNEAQLKEIKGLLAGKKMTSTQKSQLKEALSAKSKALKSGNAGDITSNSNNSVYKDYSKAEVGTDLPKGEGVLLNGTERLQLADTTLDLDSPQVKSILNRMKEGDVITVGREGDIRINDATNRVSRKHLTIEKTANGIIVKDISANGTSIAAKAQTVNKSVRNAAVAEGKVSKANASSYGKSPVEQSISFNKNHNLGVKERVLDGYKDGGRKLKFDSNGNPINKPSREIILVDRKKDSKLQAIINDVKQQTANMTEKQKAIFLQHYIYDMSGADRATNQMIRSWADRHTGEEILLGDIITANPPVAVCRHRSLLYKIVGDEIGLKVGLQRGNFHSAFGGGGHAWNTVQFSDGTSVICDAMHNKSSSITPGQVDDYAKCYFTVNNEDLYSNGLASNISSNIKDYTKAEVGTYLPNGEGVLLNGTERLKLANSTLDLNSPQVRTVLDKMKKGDVITVGREGDIRINDASNTVSRKHLTIEKTDNGFIVKDTSSNGTSIAAKRSVKNSAPAAAPAAKPTKYQDYTKAEVGTYLPNGEGVLLNGTERLKLANSTLDLNSPQVRTVLDKMKKGDVITVGREGDIRINDASNTVSRKHLTIEKTDNGFIVKDTSSNGTSIVGKKSVGSQKPNIGLNDVPQTYNFSNVRLAKSRMGASGEFDIPISWKKDVTRTVKPEGSSKTYECQVVKKDGYTYILEKNNGRGWRDGDFRGFAFKGDLPDEVCQNFLNKYDWDVEFQGKKSAIDKMNQLKSEDIEAQVLEAENVGIASGEPVQADAVEVFEMDGTPVLTGKFKNLGKQVDKATTLKELDQIEDSIRFADNSPQKEALLNKIKEKRAEITNRYQSVYEDQVEDAIDYKQQQRLQDDLNNQFAADPILYEQMDDNAFHMDDGIDGMF